MSVGSKTPVQVLQEFSVRLNMIPDYKIVYQENGTHKNLFRYEVSVGPVCAEGEGNSKKNAKHEAASNLMEKLRHNPLGTTNNFAETCVLAENVRDLSLPQEGTINYNAIGELNEYCTRRKHPLAEFVEVSDEGPAHARCFTYRCNVSSLSALAQSRTKKQAKQQAAHDMLMKLKKQDGEEVQAIVKNNDVRLQDLELNKSEDVNARWEEISRMNAFVPQGPYTKFKDFHKTYIGMSTCSSTLSSLIDKYLEDADSWNDINHMAVFDTITTEMNMTVKKNSYPVGGEQMHFLQLNTPYPPLVGAGFSVDEATKSLLKTMMQMMKQKSACTIDV